jgi:hypothetical protein
VGVYDRSDHPTVVEYAVRTMMKGKSPASAAKDTVKKLSGSENIFFGPGVTTIDPKKLEDALWARLVACAIHSMKHIREGKEHFALDGTLSHFDQKPSMRKELKRRTIEALGYNPFVHDDR